MIKTLFESSIVNKIYLTLSGFPHYQPMQSLVLRPTTMKSQVKSLCSKLFLWCWAFEKILRSRNHTQGTRLLLRHGLGDRRSLNQWSPAVSREVIQPPAPQTRLSVRRTRCATCTSTPTFPTGRAGPLCRFSPCCREPNTCWNSCLSCAIAAATSEVR